MILSEDQTLLLKREKGELNISIVALSEKIDISRFALARALKGEAITNANAKKINDWLISQALKK